MAGEPTVEIKITTDASSVARSLNKLADAMKKVKEAANGLNMHEVANGIYSIKRVAEGFDVSNVARGLNSITRATKKLVENSTLENLQRLATILAQIFYGVKSSASSGADGMQAYDDSVVHATTDLIVFKAELANVSNAMATYRDVVHGYATVMNELKLPAGENALSTDADAWKRDAIPVEGYVHDTYEAIEATKQFRIEAGRAQALLGEGTRISLLPAGSSIPLLPEGRGDFVPPGIVEDLETLKEESDRVSGSIVDNTETSNRFAAALSAIKGAAGKAASGFATFMTRLHNAPSLLGRAGRAALGFASSVMRIAKIRFIRAIIRQFTEGVSEGVKNMREYSAHIGSSFAPAMDSASQALLKMKNSVGAALAPVLEALIPILKRVVSWVITALNYVNQFFALLTGKNTWTMAIDPANDAAEAVDDIGNAASGATSKINELLAGFDELNIIQSESGHGGGGGGGAGGVSDEYQTMFTEVSQFDEKLKNTVAWLKDNFELIKDIAIGIGGAILAWDVSKAFSLVLGQFAGLIAMETVVVGLTVYLNYLFSKKYLDTGKPGFLLAEILTGAFGSLIAGVLAKNIIGGSAGLYAAGITLIFTAVASIIPFFQKGEGFTREGIIQTLLSGLELGAGIAILSNSFLGLNAMHSLLAGGGAAAIAIGVVVAIKAFIDTANNPGDLNLEDIALSAALIGLGTALVAAAGGVTASMAVAAGCVGLVASGVVLGVAITVMSLIDLNKDKIQWGDVTLTQKEVETWVQANMFGIDVVPTISLVGAKLDDTKTAKENLESSVTSLIPDVNLVRLGLATEETYDNILKGIFGESLDGEGGVIGSVKAYCRTQTTMLETGFALIPIYDDAGKDVSTEYIQAGQTGWAGVEAWFQDQGRKIGEAIKYGTVAGMEGTKDEIIATLMQETSDATRAITQARIGGQAFSGLVAGIGDFSQATASEVLNQFGIYKQQLTEQYTAMYQEMIVSFRELAAFYETTEGPGSLKAAYYQQKADELSSGMVEMVRTSVDEAIQEGKDYVGQGLAEMFNIGSTDVDNVNVFKGFLGSAELDINYNDIESARRNIENALNLILRKALSEEDYNIVQQGLQSGLINYGDLFTEEIYNSFSSLWQDNPYYGVLDEVVDFLFGKKSDMPKKIPQVSTSEFEESMTQMADTTERETDRVLTSLQHLVDAAYAMSGIHIVSYFEGVEGKGSNKPVFMKASGGIVGTGDMFIARESGPEMVGRIGNRTAVANNDQIVSGVASGVAAGQSEQNALLRQQNEYLLQLLNKKSDVVVHPSSAWGRFNEQSGSMYRRATGVAR